MQQAFHDHVVNPNFGYNVTRGDGSSIEHVLNNASPGSSSEAQVLLRLAYEIDYGIHDHTVDLGPLASIKMHETERYYKHSSMYRSITKYRLLRIKDNFNLSILEYLALPRDYQEMLEDITQEFAAYEKSIQDDVEDTAKQNSDRLMKDLTSR